MVQSRRVTIMIESELDKKVRHIQAYEIKTKNISASYSSVINTLIKKGISK